MDQVGHELRTKPVFNLVDVVLILVFFAAALIVCIFAGGAIFVATHSHGAINAKDLGSNALLVIPVQVAAYILTVGFMVLLISHKYRMSFLKAVEWNMPQARFAWLAFGAGIGLAVGSQLIAVLLQRWMPQSVPLEDYLRTAPSAYALSLFGILVAPAVEELFFRGLLYPALARPLGVAPAMALTAAGFALIHAPQLAHAWAPLLVLFIVGLVLTAVRARFMSVAVCVLMHMGYNFTLFTLLFLSTQGFRHMERAT